MSGVAEASDLERLLHEASKGNAHRVFALFDAARIPGLPVLLQQLDIPHACLFRGEVKEDLAHAAPYVARLTFNSVHFEWLSARPEDAASAVFGISDASGNDVLTHLRRFLLVLSPEGQERFFRFYDPRVLGPFLAASTLYEKQQFFGPSQKFMAWDSKTRSLREWPAPPPLAHVHYPDAHNKFRLRPEHEAAFSSDALARYDERLIEHLRMTFFPELEKVKPEDIHSTVVQARQLGPLLGITAGRDITTLAEVLVLGLTPEIRSEIDAVPPREKPKKLADIRNRLFVAAIAARQVPKAETANL